MSTSMLSQVLLIYGSILLGAFLPTVILILAGASWGQLPIFYLRIVSFLQSFFEPVYPRSRHFWPAIIKRDEGVRLKRTAESSSASFNFLNGKSNALDMGLDFTQNGLEALLQDEISTAFAHAPTYDESLLRYKPLEHWSIPQKALFYVLLAFRLFILLPVRMALFISSFVFISLACVLSFCTTLTAHQKTSIGIIYCRIFNASLGLVAIYKDKQHIPKRPGIAVSNHLSPNDIQIIFAGTEHGAEYAYMVTGQKHNGIIGVIEALVSRLCPSLWLERKCSKDRAGFLSEVLKVAKEDGGPILIFPEGYCTNNTQVLQFRKAVFEDDINIHPIAIRQNARFGDNFWFEDKFHIYLLRIMLSWAIVYEVTYLPLMKKDFLESNGQFASRVQEAIASAAGLQQGRFDGGFWYKKEDQKRLFSDQQKLVAASLSLESGFLNCEASSDESISSYCICNKPEDSE